MSDKKIITVFGATGNQGGSVIKTLLANPEIEYTIRGVTRDPSKPNAQALKSKGVELVSADLNDPKSVTNAIKGSTAVFAVTNYWETMSKTTEITQGKNVVDACLSTRVQHLIWSSLPSPTKMTSGQLTNIEHFDSKHEVSEYAESRKQETGMHVTHFQPAYFATNIKQTIRPDSQSGIPTCTIPWNYTETHIPILDIVNDTGKYVVGALSLGSSANGAFIQGVSQWLTPKEVLDTISRHAGVEIKFQEVPSDIWASYLPMPELAQKELGENMDLIREWSYYGKGSEKNQGESEKFVVKGEKLVSWEEFVEREGGWKW